MTDRPPCEVCPVLAICRLKDTIVCEILVDFLQKRRKVRTPSNSLRESLNAEMLMWKPEGALVTVVRDKQLANDLRNAGEDKK